MSNFEETLNAHEEEKETGEKKKPNYKLWEEERVKNTEEATRLAVSDIGNFQKYLAVQSRFERYSTGNNLLIFAQRPEATRLKEYSLWNKDKTWVKKNAKAVYIYEPQRREKDGKTYTNFVRKPMIDVADVKDPPVEEKPTYTGEQLVYALTSNKTVDVVIMDDYPEDRKYGAYFDANNNCIYARKGMKPEGIYTSVAIALAHAYMAKDAENYVPAEHQFEAISAAYILCEKYGVPSEKLKPQKLPEAYASMDTKEIYERLSAIHDSVKHISGGMYKDLTKEQEKDSPKKDKGGRDER